MNDFEDRLRRTLNDGSRHTTKAATTDTDQFLTTVRKGVRRRKQRRAATATLAAVAVISAGVFVSTQTVDPTSRESPIATSGTQRPDPSSSTTTPSSTTTSTSSSSSSDSTSTSSSESSSTSRSTEPRSTTTKTTSTSSGKTRSTTTVSTGTTKPPPNGATNDPPRWKPAEFVSMTRTPGGQLLALVAADGPGCTADEQGGSESASCVQVYRSSDSGASWEPLGEIPPDLALAGVGIQEQAPGKTVGRIAFSGDGQHGWVWGSEILATHDGGLTWEATSAPSLYSPSQSSEYNLDVGDSAVVARSSGGMYGDPLLRASLDSSEFAEIDAPTGRPVMGGDTIYLETYAGNGTLQRSTNLGASWSTVQPCDAGQPAGSVTATGSIVWAACQESGFGRVFVRSANDGDTFDLAAGGQTLESDMMFSMVAVDADTAFGSRLVDLGDVSELTVDDANPVGGVPELSKWSTSGYGDAVGVTYDGQAWLYTPDSGWSRIPEV